MSISSALAAEYHNEQLKLYAERIEDRLYMISGEITDKELARILAAMKSNPFSE